MNKHKSNKIKENSNTVRHLIMGQITTTKNLVAIKEVRHAGQSPGQGVKPCRQWGRVWWLLVDHRDRLLNSSFSLILDSSVGLSTGIHAARDSVPQTLGSNPAFYKGNNWSPFDSISVPCCQLIKINTNKRVCERERVCRYATCLLSIRNHFPVPEHYKKSNNKYVYRQSQGRSHSGSEIQWAECSLIIGTGCWVQVFAWSLIAQSVCKWAISLLAIWCLILPGFEFCFQQRKTTCLLSILNHSLCQSTIKKIKQQVCVYECTYVWLILEWWINQASRSNFHSRNDFLALWLFKMELY